MSRTAKLTGLVALLASATALACGPDFPFEFLSHRDKTVARLPDGLFLLEAQRLVDPPAHRYPVVEHDAFAASGDGAGPREQALYEKGAPLWHEYKRDASRPPFEKLLALPERERKAYTLPALYSLAESSEPTEAHRHFEQLRALVEAGWADPLGLAAASLGEEAKLALTAGDDARAITLYARQAAHGSENGATSLLFVARQLLTDEARLKKALAEPMVQRLMATYLWTRSTEWWWENNGHAEAQAPAMNTVLAHLLALPHVAGGDRLAAALFRAGRFEEAARLVEPEQSPIAHWVKAKLLLRRGERVKADQELEAAAAGYPLSERWTQDFDLDFRPRQQIEMERTIIALGRDDFDGAMRHAEASCSWEDVAYLVERVLDVETAKRLLSAPAPTVNPCKELEPLQQQDSNDAYAVVNQREKLKVVLARRLLREGKGRDALPWFDDTLRPDAEKYLAALSDEGTGLTRAQHLYEAAQLARHKGMELLGYEGTPDYASFEGMYDPGLELDHDAGVSDEEWRRYTASGPRYPMRFQYRAQASRLAELAANQVDHRSQAFTALLCKAAAWVGSGDQARVEALWKRSVKEGPYLQEPIIFAEQCPEPRFVPPPVKVKPFHVRIRWIVLGGGVLALGALGLVLARRRRA